MAQKKAEDKVEKKTEEMSSPGPAAGGPLRKGVTGVIRTSTSPVPASYKLQKKA